MYTKEQDQEEQKQQHYTDDDDDEDGGDWLPRLKNTTITRAQEDKRERKRKGEKDKKNTIIQSWWLCKWINGLKRGSEEGETNMIGKFWFK